MNTGYRTASEQETRKVARDFGAGLLRGDVVALYGDLGAGKTQFVKGLCEAFGVSRHVASPTFVFLHRYVGRDKTGEELLLHHFDLYRVRSAGEIFDLGYEEFVFGDGICVIEWADQLGELLPADRYDVRIELGNSEHERNIGITRVRAEVSSGRKSP